MKPTLLICVALISLGFFNRAKAQTESDDDSALADSSTYNMGRVVLKKRDVQAVIIKAADLEKMPFVDLKDAINVYVNGIFSAKQRCLFVIDGDLNTDVNAYSIYDIEELTFIQNAATVLNGGDPTQALILVKTKRGGSQRFGVNVAGQTNLVRLYKSHQGPTPTNTVDRGNTSTNLYHQYYISAYANSDAVSAGVSGDIQHDVFPHYQRSSAGPFKSDRFKLHGYLDAHIGSGNLLSINAGYARQNGNQSQDLVNLGNNPNVIYTDLNFTTNISPGFVNILSGGFQRLRHNSPADNSGNSINSYIAQDNISYETRLGDITLRPNANFTLRQATNPTFNKSNTNGYTFINDYIYSQKLGILTPSISVGYSDFVTLTGGFQTYLNSNTSIYSDYVTLFNGAPHGYVNTSKTPAHSNRDQTTPLPFANLSINPLILADVDTADAKLTVFGSYARNFNNSNDLLGRMDERNITANGDANNPLSNYYFLPATDPYKVYTQIQGGATLSLLENALTFSYNYSMRRFNTGESVLILLPVFSTQYFNTDARIELHRAGVEFTLPTDGDLTWRTNLNGTLLIMRDSYKVVSYLNDYLRLTYPGKPLITGGFVNQLGYQNLFLDFSMLYCMNQAVITSPAYARMVTGKTNTFDLQSIDLGYKIPAISYFKNLEVYLNARNLFQNGQSAITETRRFFGAGFKVGL